MKSYIFLMTSEEVMTNQDVYMNKMTIDIDGSHTVTGQAERRRHTDIN